MAETLRVLLVEDSEEDAELVLRSLSRGGYEPESRRVETAAAMEAALDAGPWDVIISDHSMPGFNSFDALAALRRRAADVPFIIVSGTIGEETAVQAMKAGAQDYVMKQNLARLAPAVARELREAAERRKAADALRASQEQLRQSQKMDAIGRLAGGIAHDFNNLLTAIIGYSELLLHEIPADDPRRGDIQEIKTAGDRAAALTKQLLAFSRQQVLEPRVVDLNTVIAGMDQLFQRLLGEDIHLNFSTDPDLDPIKADPGQIGQVLMNLVVNARDAMAGGGRLTIETSHADLDEEFARTHLDAAPGSYVLLAVSDNGCGMDAETRTRIFEPFFTTKAQGEGTGLGLSTVYGIVAQSRGYVSVYSEPGIGTTFKVYLPRVKEPLSVAAVRPAAIAATSGTVLVADDEPAICELVGKVLGAHGYTVLIAADSTRAIAAAREHSTPVDLLITDVIMPGMNGPELAAAIGAHHAGMRVLYLSGYTDRAIVNNDVIPPNVTFLQKPFTPAVLLEKVQQVLGTDRPSP